VPRPWVYPLAYWGSFGAGIIWLVTRPRKKSSREGQLSTVPETLQGWVLGIGITVAVIGLPYFVMAWSKSVTLGHVVLMGTLFEAAIVIAGMSGSAGWLLASVLWATTTILIVKFPDWQDFTLGASVALGFATVGLVRGCLVKSRPDVRSPPSPSPKSPILHSPEHIITGPEDAG
jgi:hypothetical protein